MSASEDTLEDENREIGCKNENPGRDGKVSLSTNPTFSSIPFGSVPGSSSSSGFSFGVNMGEKTLSFGGGDQPRFGTAFGFGAPAFSNSTVPNERRPAQDDEASQLCFTPSIEELRHKLHKRDRAIAMSLKLVDIARLQSEVYIEKKMYDKLEACLRDSFDMLMKELEEAQRAPAQCSESLKLTAPSSSDDKAGRQE
mmetsp:Transcript_1676/g.3903  ORF Transcript_1676/g.3903 Transcript_1676/m.3903 type:complete len:197 (+) Transcript_1676:86-676(+)